MCVIIYEDTLRGDNGDNKRHLRLKTETRLINWILSKKAVDPFNDSKNDIE